MTSLNKIRRSGLCFRFLPCQHHSIILWSHPIPTEEPIQNCQLWEIRTIILLFTLTLPKPSRHITEFNIYVFWLKVEVCRKSAKQSLLVSSNPCFMCHTVLRQSQAWAQAAQSKDTANEDEGSGTCKKPKNVATLTQWVITPFLITWQKTPCPLTVLHGILLPVQTEKM